MVQFQLPINYFQTSIDQLQKLQIDDVLRSAKNHVKEENVSIVVIGDRKIIEPQINDLVLPLNNVDMYGTKMSEE